MNNSRWHRNVNKKLFQGNSKLQHVHTFSRRKDPHMHATAHVDSAIASSSAESALCA